MEPKLLLLYYYYLTPLFKWPKHVLVHYWNVVMYNVRTHPAPRKVIRFVVEKQIKGSVINERRT